MQPNPRNSSDLTSSIISVTKIPATSQSLGKHHSRIDWLPAADASNTLTLRARSNALVNRRLSHDITRPRRSLLPICEAIFEARGSQPRQDRSAPDLGRTRKFHSSSRKCSKVVVPDAMGVMEQWEWLREAIICPVEFVVNITQNWPEWRMPLHMGGGLAWAFTGIR
jgi:hypothetical protein